VLIVLDYLFVFPGSNWSGLKSGHIVWNACSFQPAPDTKQNGLSLPSAARNGASPPTLRIQSWLLATDAEARLISDGGVDRVPSSVCSLRRTASFSPVSHLLLLFSPSRPRFLFDLGEGATRLDAVLAPLHAAKGSNSVPVVLESNARSRARRRSGLVGVYCKKTITIV
jgi:hypothetical protein